MEERMMGNEGEGEDEEKSESWLKECVRVCKSERRG